jgi:hypothetical protein
MNKKMAVDYLRRTKEKRTKGPKEKVKRTVFFSFFVGIDAVVVENNSIDTSFLPIFLFVMESDPFVSPSSA